MPNRWERVNGNLVPKNYAKSTTAESVQVLPDYSKTDDFSYASSPTTDYTVVGTWSAVADGSNFVSGTVAGNSGGIVSPISAGVDSSTKVTLKARVALTNADTELFAYIGFFQTNPTDADPPVEGDDAICFRLVETTTDNNWDAVTATDLGTTETVVDTGVVVDLATFHDFEIVLDNGTATFSIDGAVVGRSTTNLPVGTALLPIVKVTTGDTSAKGVDVDVLSVINGRA